MLWPPVGVQPVSFLGQGREDPPPPQLLVCAGLHFPLHLTLNKGFSRLPAYSSRDPKCQREHDHGQAGPCLRAPACFLAQTFPG